MRRKDFIMSETKKFNLVKYVYGRLFAEQFLGGNAEGCLFEETSKIYSWKGILHWLKKEGYIFDFVISNVDEKKSVVAYKFNRQRTMYDWYLQAIERNLKKNSLGIVPMGELIEQKAYDEFEAQYNMPVEYIQRADRCLAELNKKIMEELANQQADTDAEDNEEIKAA